MFILNTTFIIHQQVLGNWKRFMREVYIPLSLDEIKFDDVKVLNVHVEQEGGEETYTLQLTTQHRENIDFYLKEIQPRLLRELGKVFSESVMHFSSLLEEVSLHE